MTDITVLRDLELNIGDVISLIDLDYRVEEFIDDEDILTPLQSYNAEEILNWGQYIFYLNEDDEYYYRINFKVVNNTGDENALIEITK